MNSTEEHIGYWFAGQSEISDPKTRQSFPRIKNADNTPPYMIVNKKIQSVIVTASIWPGYLWRVRVVKLGDMSGLIANPGYWRATEIELIEELPVGMLFGAEGDRIVPLLGQIMTLASSEADALYTNRVKNSCAEAAYTHAWRCWNENQKYPRSHTHDDGMTLASPGNHDKETSPINYGFSLIHDLVWQRAREVEGQKAFIEVVEYGETELELNQRWSAVSAAFLYKAMALSMSQYLSDIECEALTRLWASVFGHEEMSCSKYNCT